MASSNATVGSIGGLAGVEDRFCTECDGKRWGWIEYQKVGPNLPQKRVRFTCGNCQTEQSCGLVYRYPGRDRS